MEENKVGRPAKYKNAKQMQRVIDKYFKDCEGRVLKNEHGTPMMDKHGNVIVVGDKPLTITGLALALGFNSRQSLLNYQDKEEFMDTITRAKSRIEQYAEERLYDRDGAKGAEFTLRNNFVGWDAKTNVGIDAAAQVVIADDIPDES